MKKTTRIQIMIPQGHFEGRCEDCIHSIRTYQDKGNQDKDNREMYCAMYRKTFFPKNMEEADCTHYKMKIWSKIKRILAIGFMIYIIVGVLEIILGIL